jgi:hypothetical protein
MPKSLKKPNKVVRARALIGAIAASTLLLAGTGAHADKPLALVNTTPVTINPATCTYGYGLCGADWSLPTDGKLYAWNFSFTSADPNATLYIAPPNQVDPDFSFPSNNLFGHTPVDSYTGPALSFKETLGQGFTSILYQAPLDYNNCPGDGLYYVSCGVSWIVWGNADGLTVTGNSPLTFTSTFAAVPEPMEWALLLTGFGGLGLALRRKSAARRQGAQVVAQTV